MKNLVIFLWVFLAAHALADDEVIDLVAQRERAKVELDSLGYLKWKKATEFLSNALIDQAKSDLEVITLDRRIKELKLEYLKSKEGQTKVLEEAALMRPEEAVEKAKKFQILNDSVEENIAKGKDELKILNELLVKKVAMVEFLTETEGKLRKQVDLNREQINQLVDEWTDLDQRIKKIDAAKLAEDSVDE